MFWEILKVVKEAKLQGASRIIGVDNKSSKADEGTVVTLTFNFTE